MAALSRAVGACLLSGMRELVVSYNCMSLKQCGRLSDIHSELHKTSVLCLQGTRRAADPQHAVEYTHVDGRNVFESGYGPRSNKHAGVSISLAASKHKREELTHVAWPKDPCLAGRGLAVRSRRLTSDITFICAYVPPQASGKPHNIAVKLYDWVAQVLNKLPARTLPVLCLDANAWTGLDGSGVALHSAAIGPFDSAKENTNGRIFREFLERFYLVAVNTMVGAGPTYFSGTFETASRIDYICVPQGWWWSKLVQKPQVFMREGDRLQLVGCARRVDHRPVGAWLFTSDLQYSTEQARQLDGDTLVLMMVLVVMLLWLR